jgi:uncharacterized integral membrane protein
MADELQPLDEDALGQAAGDTAQPDVEQAAYHPARAVAARKPGLFGRISNRMTEWLARIEYPQWNLRNFLYGLAILVALILIGRNWVDVRLDLVLWRFDVPKSVLIILALLLGAGLMRGWDMYQARRADRAEHPEVE